MPGGFSSMVEYDNRALADRLITPLARLSGVGRRGTGKPHFVFTVNEMRIAYCYIRKNASSSFKKIITDFSEHRDLCPRDENPIRFMVKYHEERSLPRLEACDVRMFVYRCPIRRITSLFVNKFIMRSGAEDIFRSYEAVTGKDASTATFREFVCDYLGSNDLRALDPHVWPQTSHLHSIKYNHAVFMGDLRDEMSRLLGPSLADRYFSAKVNASGAPFEDKMGDLSDKPAVELSAIYENKGAVPSHEQLAGEDIDEALQDIFSDDVEMFRQLMKKRTPLEAASV